MASGINNGWFWNQLKRMSKTTSTLATGLTGVSKVETLGETVRVKLTLDAKSIAMIDAGAAGSHGSLKLIDLPAGYIVIPGATTDLTIARVGTALTAASAVVAALGSTATTNANATLTTTEADIVPSTTATLSSGAGTFKGKATAISYQDATASTVSVYLNFATPDAGSTGDDALLVSGTIQILVQNSGDN